MGNGACTSRCLDDDRVRNKDIIYTDWRCSLPAPGSTQGSGSASRGRETLFVHHVRFEPKPGEVDHNAQEHEVFRSLVDLVYVRRNEDATAKTERCVWALRDFHASHSEALPDLVVPIANVILHAPLAVSRTRLWEEFVQNIVATDILLGHLFYWAFKCAADSPMIDRLTKSEASDFAQKVADSIRPPGRRQSSIMKAPVTPLVDLLERLHMIGEQIVKVKDKKQRLKTLKRYIDEQINGDHGVGRSAVPFSLLTSGETRIAGERVDATLLRLPTEGCKVLTSKERAPFSVLIEVSYRPRQKAVAGKVSNRGCFDRFCCRRSQLVSSTGRDTLSPEPTIREVALREMFARHHSGSEDNLGRAVSSDKPLAQPKGLFADKSWKEMRENVKRESPFSSRPTWNLIPLIIKSRADDIRQEELAYRLVKWFQRVFKRRGLGDKLWLRPYIIVATTYDGGCLELMPDAISVHALKAYYGDRWVSLKHYFEQTFTENGKSPLPLHEALVNFVSSLAAYSIVCYVLAIRDRHNGNIMLSNEGHIIHIDYGFMLCGAPGGKMLQRLGGFEPSGGFKLPTEFVEVMGEDMFHQFRKSFVEGMMAVRDEAGELLAMLQLSMLGSENHSQPCFNHPKGYPEAVIEDVRARLKLTGEGTDGDSPLPEQDFRHFCEDMIDYSHGNWRSGAYDYVQYVQNGIR